MARFEPHDLVLWCPVLSEPREAEVLSVEGDWATISVSDDAPLAVDLAEQFGLTLVGFVRDDSMNVYSRNDRVI